MLRALAACWGARTNAVVDADHVSGGSKRQSKRCTTQPQKDCSLGRNAGKEVPGPKHVTIDNSTVQVLSPGAGSDRHEQPLLYQRVAVENGPAPAASAPSSPSAEPRVPAKVSLQEANGPYFSTDPEEDVDGAELLGRAVLPDSTRALPVVSLEGLQAAFSTVKQAIAVVRVAKQADQFPAAPAAGPSGPPAEGNLPARHHATGDRSFHNSRSKRVEDASFAVRSIHTTYNSVPNVYARSGEEEDVAVSTSLYEIPGLQHGLQYDPHAERSHRSSYGNSNDRLHHSSTLLAESQETEQVARLEPVFLNQPLKHMLDIRGMDEYTFIMEKQLLRNPMMVMLFENSVKRLLDGKATSVRQYMPYFTTPATRVSMPDCNFINLQIDTCCFQDEDGSIAPALFLWYNAPSSQMELTSQLKRDYMALCHIPSKVTVFATDGRVLHQNGHSVAYMGFVMGSKAEGTHLGDERHKLRRLFAFEPQAFQDMLQALGAGKVYHGLLRMPAQLDLTDEIDGSEDGDNFGIHEDVSGSSFVGDLDAVPQLDRSGPRGSDAGRDNVGRNTQQQQQPEGCDEEEEAIVLPHSLVPVACNGLGASGAMGRAMSVDTGDRLMYSSMDTAADAFKRSATGGSLLRDDAAVNNSGPLDARPSRSSSKGFPTSFPSTAASAALARYDGPSRFSFSTPQSRAGAPPPSSALRSRAMMLHKRRLPNSNQRRRQSELEQEECWHQIQASKFQDPVTGEDSIMLVQTNVSSQVYAERQLRQVLDAEHKLLEEIFPRQVLEVMTAAALRGNPPPGEEVVGAPGSRVRRGSAQSDGCHPISLMSSGNRLKMALKHEQVTILFADIVGFTAMSMDVEPDVVMDFLNDLYTKFDELLEEHSVYKVETIGDCYMAAGGLVFTDAQGYKTVLQSKVDPKHAQRLFSYACAMLAAASQLRMPGSMQPVQLRVGMHSGPVMSGVVGMRMPRFCLFGDTVNTASRMETTGPPGKVHVSDITRKLLGDLAASEGGTWEASGGVELKGRGSMQSFYYTPGKGKQRGVAAAALGAVAGGVAAVSAAGDGHEPAAAWRAVAGPVPAFPAGAVCGSPLASAASRAVGGTASGLTAFGARVPAGGHRAAAGADTAAAPLPPLLAPLPPLLAVPPVRRNPGASDGLLQPEVPGISQWGSEKGHGKAGA